MTGMDRIPDKDRRKKRREFREERDVPKRKVKKEEDETVDTYR